MRQFGSSLKHNGMSFFPVSIPNNTLLYHGTRNDSPVIGMEWLAFEIEHAEVFARSRMGRPPGRGGDRPPGSRPGMPGEPGRGPPPIEFMEEFSEEPLEEPLNSAYLHIYRTKHPISNLLYVDGMSAGKSSMGTLDTQDLVLRKNDSKSTPDPWGDRQRAADLCAIGLEWGFEGIIRMEAGFELILCNFSQNLDLVEARQRPEYAMREAYNDRQQFEYFRGVSMRYQGITAGRVELDYSNMVSAFFYPANLTNPEAKRAELPRLVSSDSLVLERIRSDVKELFLEDRSQAKESVNWQGVVDMIVTRYSERLQVISYPTSDNNTVLSEINSLLTVFINYKDPDVEAAVEKCSTHYLAAVVPRTSQDHLIDAAISTVSRNICGSLFQARGILLEGEYINDEAVAEAKVVVEELMVYLDWSTWHECGKCSVDEICFIAMWPFGGIEDHEHPGCIKSGDNTRGRGGYWE
jgi:hypothetical protein